MASKKKSKYDESVVDRVRDLISDRSAYSERDKDDIDLARSALSGWGFSEDDRAVRGNKPEITVPVLNTWINQVISAYTASPFGVGLENNNNQVLGKIFEDTQHDIVDISNEMLQNMLGVGFGYVLIETDIVNSEMGWQKPVLKAVDPRKVIVDYCEDDTLSDCECAVVVDIISKKTAKARFGLDDYQLRGNKDILSSYALEMDTKNQCSISNVYEKVEGGVRITKIVYDNVVEQTTWPLSRLPLVRFYGNDCWIDNQLHYRGVWQTIYDLWMKLNYSESEIQARMATCPSGWWYGDPKSIAENPEAFATGADVNFYPVTGWDKEKEIGVQLMNKVLGLAELEGTSNATMTMIQNVLGSITPEVKANETAESILMKKGNAEATVNKYLVNLKNSLKAMGGVLLELIQVIYDEPRTEDGVTIPAIGSIEGVKVSVDDGPIQASQKGRNLQQIMAFYSMAKESNPQAFNIIGPSILQLSEIPDDIKQALAPMFGQDQQQNIQVVQQQNAELNQQVQMLNQQLETLQTEANKQISMLQQSLFEMQTDSKASMWETQQKISADERKHMMDLQWEREKFMLEMQAKAGKLTFDAVEKEKDRQLESEIVASEMLADLEKDRERTRQAAADIQLPVFTNSKFTA